MSYALVIDDNRQMTDSVCEMLRMLNLKARPAYGPGQGIKAIENEVPGLVFLDLNMPGLSGFEVLRYLKREPRTAEVPVFIISSEDQPEVIEEARRLGIDAFISKPFTVDEVVAALRKVGVVD